MSGFIGKSMQGLLTPKGGIIVPGRFKVGMGRGGAGSANAGPVFVSGGAPAAPTSLTATPGPIATVLQWTEAAGDTGGTYVYRGTTPGGESSTAIGNVPQGTASYTDSTATAGTLYYYVVKAKNSSGLSPASNEVNATIPTGLLAYYDAGLSTLWQSSSRTGSHAVANGDPVGSWDDLSGNANHALQSTAGSRPTLSASATNSLPGISFAKASSQWLNNGTVNGASKPNNWTIYAVLADNNVNTGLQEAVYGTFGAAGTDKTTWGTVLLHDQDGSSQPAGSFGAAFGDDTNYCFASTPGSLMSNGTYTQLSAVYSAGSYQANLFQDGNQIGASPITGSTASASSGTANAGAIGAGGAAFLQHFFDGTITALLIYNTAHTPAQRQGIEASLRARYATPTPSTLQPVAFTTPSSISNLALWLDASLSTLYQDSGRTTPVTTDGQSVGSWSDLSGNANHASQSTSGQRPIYKASIVNGLGVVRSAGGTICLQTPSIALGAYATVMVVLKAATGQSVPVIIEQSATAFSDPGFWVLGGAAASGGGGRVHTNTGTTLLQAPSDDYFTNGSWSLATLTASAPSPDTSYIWLNATLGTSPATVGGTAIATDVINIFSRNNGASLPLAGDIAAIVIYNKELTEWERQQLVAYFDARFALGF